MLARNAANGKDIRIGGGANTVQQFLQERLIDEMHIAIAPVILGTGEALFQGVNLRQLGYVCTQQIGTEMATHCFISKDKSD